MAFLAAQIRLGTNKIMKFGIFTHYFDHPIEIVVDRIRHLGLECAQLNMSFKNWLMDEKSTSDDCRWVAKAFTSRNLSIEALSGYRNLVAPDAERRSENVKYIRMLLARANDLESPLVVTEAGSLHPHANVDDERGTRLAVEHLYAEGHERISMISFTWPNTTGSVPQRRKKGYRASMTELGLQRYAKVLHSEESAIDVGPLTTRILKQTERPEAIFCWNDFAALEVLSVAKRAGLSVPDQLAIVGFDNTAFCRLEQNSLSSVDQSADTLGESAARMLLERIEGRTEPRHILLEPQLVARRSSTRRPREEP